MKKWKIEGEQADAVAAARKVVTDLAEKTAQDVKAAKEAYWAAIATAAGISEEDKALPMHLVSEFADEGIFFVSEESPLVGSQESAVCDLICAICDEKLL